MAYGLIYFISEKISILLGINHVVTVFVMLFYWSIFFGVLYKNGNAEIYSVNIPKNKLLKSIIYVPLLLMPIINIVIFISRYCNLEIGIKLSSMIVLDCSITILTTLSSVIWEEVSFRGMLPVILTKWYKMTELQSAIIASVVFAAMHILNLFSGEALFDVIVQMLNAGAVGFCLAIISIREYSIFPCIVIHSLINISSLFIEWGEELAVVSDRGFLSDFEFEVFWVLPILYVLYGICLCMKGIDGEKYETLH